MLVNKTGDIVANSSQIIVRFANETEYNTWKADISDDDLSKFFIIKEYEYDRHNYIEVENQTALNSLPQVQKIDGCIYGVRATNKLYRYDVTTSAFVEMAPAGAGGTKYLHKIIIISGQDVIKVTLATDSATPITTQSAFANAFKAQCGTGIVDCDGEYKAEKVVYVQYVSASSYPI